MGAQGLLFSREWINGVCVGVQEVQPLGSGFTKIEMDYDSALGSEEEGWMANAPRPKRKSRRKSLVSNRVHLR